MPATTTSAADARRSESFSPLHLRDKVVIMALFDQIVSEEEVASLWRIWRQQHLPFFREPFWRLLTLLPRVEPELVYEQSARTDGVEKAYMTPGKTVTMLRTLVPRIPAPVWEKMRRVPVLPVDEMGPGRSATSTVVCATHDPTNPLIRELLHKAFPDSFELRYAPQNVLMALQDEAFSSTEN